ncbi:MAG TPA: hypothetical protein VJ804_02580 [Acidimicrobiales bacterium]|nr:hypothetical protein [Acidimicrobiales bacterium]
MTDTDDVTTDTTIDEALRIIDSGLSDLLHRELVSSDEVSDLLLDVRTVLKAAEQAVRDEELVGDAPVGA